MEGERIMTDTTGEASRLQIGSTEVVFVTDAQIPSPFPLSLEQTFPTVSEEEWREFRGMYPYTFDSSGTWSSRVGCGLIRTPERNILVDTGVGPSSTAFSQFLHTNGRLPERLRALGVAESEIDVVFLTHLHADHVGWNVGAQDQRPTFPNARYIAPGADWEYCKWRLDNTPQNAGYIHENLIPLSEQGRLELIDEAAELTDGVRTVHTPGHTPGHMSVKVESGSGGGAWILGDAAAHPLQVTKPAHSYVFDVDPDLATETRSRVLDEAETEGATVGAPHFPEPGVGSLVREGGKRLWQPTRELR